MDATPQEEAAALGGLKVDGKSFKANARKFCHRTIGRRVIEIQRAGAALASISVGSLLVEADVALTGAFEDREWSAANSCIVTKAKLAGCWPEGRISAEAKIEQAKEAQHGKEGEVVVTRFTLSIFDEHEHAAA
ncbi:MAG: hypothetical protein ACREHV_15575 [Rhizomicrobium sp.]